MTSLLCLLVNVSRCLGSVQLSLSAVSGLPADLLVVKVLLLIAVWLALLLLFVHICIGINYKLTYFAVVAKLIVHWWLFGRFIMVFSSCLFTKW